MEAAHRLDVRDLSVFPDASFDSVVCFGAVLGYVRNDIGKALDELIRVTKPGGTLFLSTPGLWGNFRFGVIVDAAGTCATLPDHFEWDGEADLGESLSTRPDSSEFHLPMTFLTARSLRTRVEDAGLTVLEMATAAPLSSRGQYESIEKDPAAAEFAMRLELMAATRPELLDSGEHLVVAARVSPR